MTTERHGDAQDSDLSATAPRQKASAVYEDLRTRILGGRLECGVWLRAEALADELNVSRTPVREAFRQLASDGLIELIPNRGARVALISDEDLEATYELHAILEGYGARRAAELQLADVGRLRELCDVMERTLATGDADRYDEITRLNLEFHGDIHRASGNVALPGMIAGFAQRSLVRHTFANYTPAEIERAFDQHREMTDAIEARDGALAEAIMRSHVLGARTTLRRRLAELAEQDEASAS
ncbi:GntR family transcriptional regulator [Flexivirga meconopsidis]|uniref:GntR family transcriptional regulator n=1 Tax=Flexivirga meconopsidis TaxID=2977121 RepID=UPI00223EAABA|nr:GntR family transcriptional regulator [Flexivirga meconopsidis]